MRIQQLYETSRRAFGVYTAQMNVTGQNVANAETPGYARRRLTVTPDQVGTRGVLIRPNGIVGGGLSVQSFERMRDGLLESAAWEARAGLGGAEEETRLLSALEGLLGPSGGRSLNDVMDGFWNAWSDLADHPADTGVRQAVLAQARSVTDTLKRLDGDLARFGAEARTSLADGVEQANALLQEIADLNVTIRSARAGGSPDLGAEDRRDEAVKELAMFAPVAVTDTAEGYQITVAGMSVVQGDAFTAFRFASDGTAPRVEFGDTGVAYKPNSGGRLGGWLRTLTETLPATRDALDAFAARLAEDVNAAHAQGFGLDGSTGLAFFTGTTAGNLGVADLAPDQIATAGTADAPGDSSIALSIGALREGFDGQATSILTDLGARLRGARSAAAAQSAVVDHLDAMAAGVSAVSIDEEMTKLIEAQQAFAASARVLTTAEAMMDTLLAL